MFETIREEVSPAEIQVDTDLYIAPRTKDEVEASLLCLNHSCVSNVGVKGQIASVAMRDIESGAELNIKNAKIDGDPDERVEFSRDSESCRGIVTGSEWKRPELQERFAGHFSSCIEAWISGGKG